MKLPFYAGEYEGEFIVHHTEIINGQRHEEREWIPSTITNNDHRGNAVVIGNGVSREKFQLRLLAKHKGGLFAGLKVQTYGCNALYRDFSPDFLITQTDQMVDEIAQTDYCDNNIVYSSAKQMVKYPQKFHLIPQNYVLNAGAIATYIAAFHGHKNIYLIGFDNQDNDDYNNNIYADTENYKPLRSQVNSSKWIANMFRLFSLYSDATFHYVHSSPDYCIPEKWKWAKNLNMLTYRSLISELDIG